MKQTSRGLAPSLNTGHSTFTGARQRLAVALVAIFIAFAGAQTATAAVGDVVATGYCGTTANGADGHNLAWTLTENGEADIEISPETYTALTLTITGSGAMDDYASVSDSPWNATNTYRYRVTKLVLPEGITHIGNHAFYFTNFTGKLTIPSTVQTIGTFGFYGFHGATSVTIPASVTSIGEKGLQAFGNDASSCTVTFAEGSQLASIGANAFERVNANLDLRNCTQLTAINAEEVFKSYTKTVTFPRTMTSVCANAFKTNSSGGNPTVKLSYKGFLYINGEYQSYNANGAVRTITSKFGITPSSSKAVTIRQGVIDGLTWNTEGTYYEINDEQDLIDLGLYVIADRTNDCAGLTFKMTADLDFSEKANDERCKDKLGWGTGNFLPIGLSGGTTSGGVGFAGSFYGQGHSITGLRYNYSSVGVGLFGKINGSAVVDGVTLVSPTFRASGSVGGIVGTMYGGTVSNCAVVNGSLDGGSGNSVGGIVGYSYSGTNTISGCTVVGTSVSSSNINFDGIIVGDNGADILSISGCTYHTATGLPVCGHTSSLATTTESDNTRVYQLTIGEGITASGATYSHVLVPDKAYYANGSTVTLGHGTREGYVFDGYTASPAQTISDGTFTMPAEDVSVSATWTPDPDHFAVSSDGKTYTIKTVTGWNVFCDALQDNTTYNRFSGKTVKLGANISVTRMAGSSQHDFCGTFDGGGHTITLAIGSAESPFGEDYAALFRNVTTTKANSNDAEDSPASIHSLVVDGHIYTSKKYAAGIVGNQYGTVTISNCRSSVVIHSSVINSNNNDGTHGGIVANQHGGALTLTGCIYDGRMLTTNATTGCGGLVGYHSGGTCTISNSLYAPADCTPAQGESDITDGATICRNYSGTPANCYYTATLGSAQGLAAHTIAAGENVSIAHAGVATTYDVSHITAYKASAQGTTFIPGLLYNNNVLYAGSGDAVSLTLSADAPEGYVLTGFAASAGRLSGNDTDGYTLDMPDEDVTVSATFARLYTVTFTERGWNGSAVTETTRTESAQAVPAEGDMTQGWYYLNSNVTVKGRINLTGDVNLILADGCTLNVKGIYIPQGSTLTIYAESDGETAGKIVSHPSDGAAIGGKPGNDNGSIVIHGGSIEATGYNHCAGIGSNDGRTGGTISIYGGTVTAKGGTNGAAIGGGRNCSGGTIDIYGGDITANGPTDSETCENGAGIGGGDGGDGGTITIYGGTITTYSRDGAGIGGGDDGDGGTITINGGEITSNKVNQGQGARIGGGCDAAPGTITINGGTITAVGGSGAGIGGGKRNLANGTVTINGGVIDASGSYGIGAGEDGADVAITLGWTSSDDRINASSYTGTVVITDGKSFHNGSEVLEPGEVTDFNKLNGKTLIGVDVLQDNAANDVAALATRLGGKQTNIALSGRTLYKDGAWNTLCLPFALGDDQAESGHELDGTPLEGATLMTLGNSPACNTGFDAQTGTLNLEFLPAKTVEPGVAYIVKWPIPDGMTADEFAAAYAANPDDYDLKNPVFTGVTVTNDAPADHATTSDDTYVTFVGTYGPTAIYAAPAVNLYLGAANKLYWPTATDFELKPFRAYFQLNNGLTAGMPSSPNGVRAFSLNFGDASDQTGIREIVTDPTPSPSPAWEGSAAWYTLDGRKLQAQPTKSGLYIHGGRKVVIK